MFTLTSFVLCLPFLLFILVKWRYAYWKRKGVMQVQPEFPYGNVRQLVTGQSSLAETYFDLYKKIKKDNTRHGGIYFMFSPQYIPIDLKIVKYILQTDFTHFSGRGLYRHKEDTLSQTLFRMEGIAWKQLRTKLTPTFTSGKMKMMFETLLSKSEGLERLANECVVGGLPIKIKDVSSRFTTDVIGSCAFGLECDSLKDGNCEFRIYGNKIFEPKKWRHYLETLVPWQILGYIGYRSFSNVKDFFQGIVRETIHYRTKNNIHRNDFLQLLIELKSGQNKNSSKEEFNSSVLTEDEIISQCFLFFAAGYETSASTITFTLYELAKNTAIQQKLRNEISETLKKYNGKLTYEGIMEMNYIDQVIHETLRKYPPVSAIPRICTKTYKVPGSEVVIEKGTMVQIPVLGIHMDADYYPSPEIYDPERFNEENKSKRPEFSWLGFGEGPRMCIASRFGMLQSKVGVFGLLKNYQFTVNEDTPHELVYSSGTFITQVQHEILLNIAKV